MRIMHVGLLLSVCTGICGAQPRYEIIDLTEIGPPGVIQSEARSVNERGQIVGFEALPDFEERAILWEPDGTSRFLETLPGDSGTLAFFIGEDGVASGISELVRIEMQGHQIRVFEDQKAVFWDADGVRDLNEEVVGGDPVDLRAAMAFNSSGQIVGEGRPAGGDTGFRGWSLFDGIVTDLGELNTRPLGPRKVNGLGQIVGWSRIGQDKAFLLDDDELTNLHDHPLIGGVTSRAWDINDAGVIVGEAQFDISQPEYATVWENAVPRHLLEGLFGRPQGVASAINASGVIVGFVNDLDDLNDSTRGFLIDADGTYHELIDLVPGAKNLGWDRLIIPFDISDNGVIVGGGQRFGQLGHAFALIPICEADLDGDGGLDSDDFFLYLGLFAGGDKRADINGDGTIDADDFFAYLDLFADGCD